MISHIKTYRIVLETIGPVYIGSGASYGKKETIFYKYKDIANVYVPNSNKMYQWMIDNELQDSYQEFVLSGYLDFGMWLKNNGYKYQDYKQWIAYSLDAKDADIESKEKKEILEFMKDPYNKPYIPGSSLKGALRTVLLGSDIIERKERDSRYQSIERKVKATQFQKRPTYLREESAELENLTFRKRKLEGTRETDAVNDIMAGIRISDSKPLTCQELILCKKIDVKPNGDSGSLNILRECIRPGTKIEFELGIDTTITTITVEDIRKAINTFLECYNCNFDSKFKTSDNFRKDVIYLGGGCGYVSKSVVYPLLGNDGIKEVGKILEATLSDKAKEEHGHGNDVELGASPHTMKKTMYQGEMVSFGPCRITFEEV